MEVDNQTEQRWTKIDDIQLMEADKCSNMHVKRPLKCYDLIAYLKNHNTPHFCHDSDITYLRSHM